MTCLGLQLVSPNDFSLFLKCTWHSLHLEARLEHFELCLLVSIYGQHSHATHP